MKLLAGGGGAKKSNRKLEEVLGRLDNTKVKNLN